MEAAVNFGQNPAKHGKNRNKGIFALKVLILRDLRKEGIATESPSAQRRGGWRASPAGSVARYLAERAMVGKEFMEKF